MATGRDYLQSILSQCSILQSKSDIELNSIRVDLNEIDECIENALDALEE